MKKIIISMILALAILIACATHDTFASNTTTDVNTPEPAAETVENEISTPEVAFYATLIYEENGIHYIDFNDGSWAVINPKHHNMTFQPVIMGDFAYEFYTDEDPYACVFFMHCIMAYAEGEYDQVMSYVPDGDGNNIMTFVYSIDQINTYREWHEWLEEATIKD